MGKFVVRETATGSKFDLKAGNGEVIATSQVYASKASCLKGVESVKENAPIAPVEDRTKEGFAVEKNPKFEVYADKAGELRFLGSYYTGKLAANRLYDDYIYSRFTGYSGRCDGSGTDRRCFIYTQTLQYNHTYDDAFHNYMYLPVSYKRF